MTEALRMRKVTVEGTSRPSPAYGQVSVASTPLFTVVYTRSDPARKCIKLAGTRLLENVVIQQALFARVTGLKPSGGYGSHGSC
jgi:hypothetical protein